MQKKSVPSGILTNTGGKVIVRKMAGQNTYKGSNSNGVRSLSLPKWRESFIVSGINNWVNQSWTRLFRISPLPNRRLCVSVGKPKKGVIYPSTLDYVPSRPTYVKTSEKRVIFTLWHESLMWILLLFRHCVGWQTPDVSQWWDCLIRIDLVIFSSREVETSWLNLRKILLKSEGVLDV